LSKLVAWVDAQGGNTCLLGDPPGFETASIIQAVQSPRSGVIAAIDAMQVGLAAGALGAGRAKKGDPIDPAVGVVLGAKVGDAVQTGDTLFTIHANDEAKLVAARERLLAAYTWAEQDVEPFPLVYQVIH
jgi:pyrimidine-nucleoside phosphorylase